MVCSDVPYTTKWIREVEDGGQKPWIYPQEPSSVELQGSCSLPFISLPSSFRLQIRTSQRSCTKFHLDRYQQRSLTDCIQSYCDAFVIWVHFLAETINVCWKRPPACEKALPVLYDRVPKGKTGNISRNCTDSYIWCW